MEHITKLFFCLYVIALLLIGGSGLFIAPWELRTVFHVDLDSMSAINAATLINQYRFLKGVEFASGCFSWHWRREIYSIPAFRHTFLVIVWAGVGGRLLSVFVDGEPHVLFLGFLIIEAITGILMSLRRSRGAYA